MKPPLLKSKKRAMFYAMLAGASFCGIFFLAPLGGFTIWITVGATIYFTFLTIYYLIPQGQVNAKARVRRNKEDEELKEYVRKHTRILIAMFLAAGLFVLMFLWIVL